MSTTAKTRPIRSIEEYAAALRQANKQVAAYEEALHTLRHLAHSYNANVPLSHQSEAMKFVVEQMLKETAMLNCEVTNPSQN